MEGMEGAIALVILGAGGWGWGCPLCDFNHSESVDEKVNQLVVQANCSGRGRSRKAQELQLI